MVEWSDLGTTFPQTHSNREFVDGLFTIHVTFRFTLEKLLS